jgi:hypothetical protein
MGKKQNKGEDQVGRREFVKSAAQHIVVATAGVTILSIFGVMGCGGDSDSHCTGCTECTSCTGGCTVCTVGCTKACTITCISGT